MGRTLPTQIQILAEAEEAWKGFRRALRKEDQESFDVLWSYARRHAAASSMAARALPFEAQVLSMLTGLHREIQELKIYAIARETEGRPRHPVVENRGRQTLDSKNQSASVDENPSVAMTKPIRGQNTTKEV